MSDLDAPGRAPVSGIAAACAALAAGRPAIAPNPSPMTYGVVATDPVVVNTLKGRPHDQNVGVALHDGDERAAVVECLDLGPDDLVRVERLFAARFSLLLPLRDGRAYPDWVAPAVRNGYVAAFDPYWEPVGALWDAFARLYGSSANRTGEAAAASAADARRNFGADAPVVDADELRDLEREHHPSTMLRMASDGELHLHRSGAQDVASGLPPERFLRSLAD